MRTTRTQSERLSDHVLTLVLLDLCSESRVVGDRLKAMKLMFEASLSLFRQQAKALNYSFYRYVYGPFTPEAYETWEELSWVGWLQIEPGATGPVSVTEDGEEVASTYREKLDREWGGGFALEVFRQVADTYSSLSTPDLMKKVYSQKVIPVGFQSPIKVGEAKENVLFTCIVEEENAKKNLSILDNDRSSLFRLINSSKVRGVLPTQWDELSDDSYGSLLSALRQAKAGQPGKRVTLEQLKERSRQGQ